MNDKRVFIIKNNDMNVPIYVNAKNSYEQKKAMYYNVTNESRVFLENSANIGDSGIILMLSYDQKNENEIQDIFIGKASVNSIWNIQYIMYCHLQSEDKRAMVSIVDKIDLDIQNDFAAKTYIIISDMQSLYEELNERINATFHKLQYNNTTAGSDEATVYELSPLAQKDEQSFRVYLGETLSATRTEFQRDRERIVNSRAFRRLVDKAQIFSADKGDYYRTRMTHTLEVNQIAKAIAYALNLNLDLTEAIALGHDLGHTPFGHQGERTLDDILCGEIDSGIVMPQDLLKDRCFGGFKHNYQSAKVLTRLEEKYVGFPGLNVSIQVVEGVLKHTKIKEDIEISDFLAKEYIEKMYLDYTKPYCNIATLEGQTVAIADEIAQRGHDVDDALTSGVMTTDEFLDRLSIDKCEELRECIKKEVEEIEQSERLLANKQEMLIARIVHRIIRYFIQDTIRNSKIKIQQNTSSSIDMSNKIEFVTLSDKVKQVNAYLEKIVQKKVICNHEVARADYNAQIVIKTLFDKYYHNPRLLHRGTLQKLFIDTLKHKNLLVSNSAVNLNDCDVRIASEEIAQMSTEEIKDIKGLSDYIRTGQMGTNKNDIIIYEKRRILIRNIVDFIAGMTDGYALEEYEKLR